MSRRLGAAYQDSDESLPYSINWAPDADGPLISSLWAVRPTGQLAVTDSSFSTTVATARLAGGTPGTSYEVENTARTSAGSTLQAHLLVTIIN